MASALPEQTDSCASHLVIPAAALPPVPPAEMDPFLDAAARCFARHGIRRTSVPDIAREASTSRTTVYRQVGTVDTAAALLLARDLHRLLISLRGELDGADGPESLIRLIGAVVSFCAGHPVLRKVLTDEPEIATPFLTAEFRSIIDRVSDVVVPLLERAMDDGKIRPGNPRVLADFLVRITVSVLLSPPPGELSDFLEQVVLPTIRPARGGPAR